MKLEFESEYLPEDKCLEISNVLKSLEFDLVLKLGGASSLNDVWIAKNINADTIVAPMVESVYGFEKFIKTLLCVYSDYDLLNKKIYINIETKTGIENFQSILEASCMKYITGIIIGRSDLSSSLNMSETLTDSGEMYEIVYPVVEKCFNARKKVIMGGKISPASVSFLKKFKNGYLQGFETRKIFFPSDLLQKEDKDISFAINKAIEFELYWLQNYSAKNAPNASDIDKRILALKNRCLA